MFTTEVPADGYYTLGLRYSTNAPTTSNGFQIAPEDQPLENMATGPTTGWNESANRVYLHSGINNVTYTATGSTPANVDRLDVTPDTSDSSSVVTYQAESSANTLQGTAIVESNSYAAGGAEVGWIGNGSGNTITFNGVNASLTETYRLAITYANDDSASSGNYNENLIDRAATVATSAGTNETVHFRNTYSWSQFWTIDTTIQLTAGTNSIIFSNPTAFAPDLDQITMAPAALS